MGVAAARADRAQKRRGSWHATGRFAACVVLLAALAAAGRAAAQPSPDDADDPAAQEPRERFRISLEAKAHLRDSDENRFPIGFPFSPSMLPPGQDRGFLETVDAGSHLEISAVTLFLGARWSELLETRVKIDFVDLYDRNPTSGDRTTDVDEAWIRFGREWRPARVPERPGAYLKVGKLAKFERQNDRHLESYGLVSTAFNRFEDLGVEAGVDLGRWIYLKASATAGNPLFIRDPNALAGDNGTDVLLRPNPDPQLKSGIVLLYDAEVEDLDVDGELEAGYGLGIRGANASGSVAFDLLGFYYERDLADTVELEGTFYGGDLDLLLGPGNQTPFPVDGREKVESGGNLWLYAGPFSLFAQLVDQEAAGLRRTGYEVEAAWRFELPLVWAAGGRQLFGSIAPAVRYSRIEPDFAANPLHPAVSIAWEWEKLDYGIRLEVSPDVDLTIEYADHDFILGSGAHADNDELLVTLVWRSGWSF